jgi:hypothetical protein
MVAMHALAERRSPVRLSWRRRLRAWRHGFSSLTWVLYDLDSVDRAGRRDYVRPFRTVDYRYRLPQALAINDKLLFPSCLERLGAAHPRVLGFLHRGRVRVEGAGAEKVTSWLERDHPQRLVAKPIDGLGGEGVLFLHSCDGGWEINGVATAAPEAARFLSALEQYVITEFVVQGPYAAALYPRTTNTVRVLTLWDDDPAEPFVAAAAQRIGSSKSGPVDNFHAGRGGLSAPIDLENGTLGAAKTLADGELRTFAKHPETGAAIAGLRVDRWSEVMALVTRLAAAVPESPFVGWDLVVARSGPVLLEANAPPGYDVWQVHGPLMRDPRARRALTALGVA